MRELLTNFHDIKRGGVVELQYEEYEEQKFSLEEDLKSSTTTFKTIMRKYYAIVVAFDPFTRYLVVEYIDKTGRVKKTINFRD